MTIRPATEADRPALVRMGLAFCAEPSYAALFGDVTPDQVEAFVELVTGLEGIVLVAEGDEGVVGMIAVLVAPHPLTGELYGDEVCWWIDPTARGLRGVGPNLLCVLEEMCRARGLTSLKMIAPAGTHVGRFYERQGYRALEAAYLKRF